MSNRIFLNIIIIIKIVAIKLFNWRVQFSINYHFLYTKTTPKILIWIFAWTYSYNGIKSKEKYTSILLPIVYLYFVPFVFCCICILLQMYSGNLYFVLLYFVVFVFWIFCFCCILFCLYYGTFVFWLTTVRMCPGSMGGN